MAVYLTPQERSILKTMLEGTITFRNNKKMQVWPFEIILGKINDDIERADKINDCDHKFNNYKGTKVMCNHCGSTPEFHWKLFSKSKKNIEDYQIKSGVTKEDSRLFSAPSETETL